MSITPVICCQSCQKEFTRAEAIRAGNQCPECQTRLSVGFKTTSSQNVRTRPLSSEDRAQTSGSEKLPSGGGLDPSIPGQIGEETVAFRVRPVKGKGVEIAAVTNLFNSLAGTVNPLCLELSATQKETFYIVRCKRSQANLIRGFITGVYGSPEIEVLPPEQDPTAPFQNPDLTKGYLRLRLAKSAGLPLRSWRELADNDPIMPIFAALYHLQEHEAGLTQLFVQGSAPQNWARQYKRELAVYQRKQEGKLTGGKWVMLAGVLLSLSCLTLYAIQASLASGAWLRSVWMPVIALGTIALLVRTLRGSDLPWDESLEEIVRQKTAQQGYLAEIRIAAAAPTKEQVYAILNSLHGAYKIFGFESGNFLSVVHPTDPANIFDPLAMQPFPPGRSILGDEEIATMWHLPISELPDFISAVRVEDTTPDPASVSNLKDGWRIGEIGKAGKIEPAYIPREAITRKHALVLGKTQMGKSTLLKRLIVELAGEARGILVIDPHDDLIEGLLEALPSNRLEDVIYLNFADQEMMPGINILDVTMFNGSAERTNEAILDGAKAMFGRYWGPRMQVNFDKTMLTLALANTVRPPEQQFTVLNAIDLITMKENSIRLAFLETVLPKEHAMYRSVYKYWAEEFANLTNQMHEAVIMPVLSKLRAFERNSSMMAIFGQPKSTVNLNQALLSNKILLVKTGATHLSTEFSDFIGSFILNVAMRTIFSQGETPADQRANISLVVDESQSFSGVDYPTMLAQVAKFGANIILTTQGTQFIGRALTSDQIDDPGAWGTLMANVDTLITFRIDGQDARTLCETEYYAEKEPQTLINTKAHTAFVRYSSGTEVIPPFLVRLDPPLVGDAGRKRQILLNRGAYTLPKRKALQNAEESMDRMEAFVRGQTSHALSYAGSRGVVALEEFRKAQAQANTDYEQGTFDGLLDLEAFEGMKEPHDAD